MLFNSYAFLFVFLPIALIVYYIFGARKNYRGALAWLVCASLFFYGWWNPAYLILIMLSTVFNFLVGRALFPNGNCEENSRKIMLMVFGVTVNLAAIGYFKYANFFVDNANVMFGGNFHLDHIILPLAISFFTFQQITYLVDSHRGEAREGSFLKYCLFVTFFPQLIAGPIVHHKEMLPQFSNTKAFHFNHKRLAIGFTILVIGLFKKIVIADNVAIYATPLFDASLHGFSPTFFEAWGAALAYTFQLYFDFSGYSDMAVGLAYMFGIRLAINFYSPYKAVNIIEFWRCWHITLSRFLRDYVYISLGGNRNGVSRRYRNLLVTMLLGGLWHGAAWTFVSWGALHGLYLVANNLWRYFRIRIGHDLERNSWCGRGFSQGCTFLAVVVGWVVFRAESFPSAISILQGMSGINGFALPSSYLGYFNYLFHSGDWLSAHGWIFSEGLIYFGGGKQFIILTALLWWLWFLPNTYQIMGKYSPALDISSIASVRRKHIQTYWSPSTAYALLVFLILLVTVFRLDGTSEFLYFQF